MMFSDPFAAVRECAPDDVRVCDDVPVERPARFITVDYLPVGSLFSGLKQRVLSRRRLLIYAWGAGVDDSRSLCEELRDNLLAYRGSGFRRFVIVGEPSRRDDPESGHHRFVMTVDAHLRASF